MDKTIDMARKAGLAKYGNGLREGVDAFIDAIKAFEALVRADEAEKYKWDVHSCGHTCTRVACVALREAVQSEREACAKVCDDLPTPERMSLDNESLWEAATLDCADAIRARGNT